MKKFLSVLIVIAIILGGVYMLRPATQYAMAGSGITAPTTSDGKLAAKKIRAALLDELNDEFEGQKINMKYGMNGSGINVYVLTEDAKGDQDYHYYWVADSKLGTMSNTEILFHNIAFSADGDNMIAIY